MNIYRRLLAYIKPYKGRLLTAIACMFAFSAVNSLVSVIPYLVINALQNKDQVVVNNIPHVPFLNGISFPAYWAPILMLVVFIFRNIFEYISHYEMAAIGIRAIRQVRDDLYKHLVHLSHDYYSKGRTGDFLSRIMNDVGSIQGAITDV